jgi:hypothetical protein
MMLIMNKGILPFAFPGVSARFVLPVLLIALLPVIVAARGGAMINVSTSAQLMNAVATANSNGGDTTIVLADGTYTLSDTLYVNAPDVTIKSASGNRANVIVQGDAMSASAVVKNVIRAAAANFTIESVTLQKSGWHLIQIVGENNADFPVIRNVIFRNAWEQMLKVTYNDANTSVGSDNGLVEASVFEFTAGLAGQYYTGGIDAHNARNWVVRGNTFRNIASPNTAIAEHAIHFWSGSADTLVEKNLIINCDRGIGFGLLQGRGHLRGIVRNNMIYHAAGGGNFADVAIEAAESPGTQIYNNTIFMQNGYPNAIEYRYPQTSGLLIANNLTNKAIQARDGATATVTDNLTNALASWFVGPSTGDLHLASATGAPIDAGQSVLGLSEDIDSQPRPQGAGIDVGADEYAVAAPMQVLTGSLPGAIRFRPYNQTVQASGGSGVYIWSVTSGTLPPGLWLDPAAGSIRGRLRLKGSWSFTLTAQDAQNAQATASRFFTVTGRLY